MGARAFGQGKPILACGHAPDKGQWRAVDGNRRFAGLDRCRTRVDEARECHDAPAVSDRFDVGPLRNAPWPMLVRG